VFLVWSRGNNFVQRFVAVVLFCVALGPVAGAADSGGESRWRSAAEEVLLLALRKQYPEVAEWVLQPLVGRRQDASLQSMDEVRAQVTRIGKRSAVRLMHDARRTSATLWFSVEGVRPLLVMKQNVKAGAALGEQMAESASRDVLSVPCTVLGTPAALEGMRAKRSMSAGDVLCEEQIEVRPAVGRGEAVTVVSVVGAVAITAKAVAEQDGSPGERLRVRSASTGETFYATVRGAGEVVVHE
jgi:flagella basal body P-ring formation protein FlgA